MFMVCIFVFRFKYLFIQYFLLGVVQAKLQQGKYIQIAPKMIVFNIPAGPSSVRETTTDLPAVLPTQNDHSSTVRVWYEITKISTYQQYEITR